MPYFLYIYLRIYASLEIFAIPLIVLQFGVLIRTILLIKKYRLLKSENKVDKKETVLIISYSKSHSSNSLI